MINFVETQILNVIAHGVENRNNGGKLFTSLEEMELDEKAIKELTKHFIKPFANREDFHHFTHDIDLKMNEVFVSTDNIFEDENFILNSANIAKHLYASTRHHAIKDGELLIAFFDGIEIDKKIVSAVGIYKSEKKQNFFKLRQNRGSISVELDKGIGQYKIDKACLVFNTGYKDGFKVLSYEHNGLDADYWKSDFLSIKPTNDSYSQTDQLIGMCKNFIVDEMNIPKIDQINLLNRSVELLSASESVSVQEFTKTVFQDSAIQNEFSRFQSTYISESANDLPSEITVSKSAIKKQARHLKSVLKLDKNFHIYIHGDRERIEQGVDEHGRKYYKFYYDDEA